MDLSTIFETWKNALTQPNEDFYLAEQQSPHATLQTALIWIVAAAVVSAFLGAIGAFSGINTMPGFMEEMMSQSEIPPEARAMMESFLTGGAISGMAGAGILLSIVWAPIGFLFGTGILHVIASLLGGQGNFGRYAYLLATFQAPITIINAILGLASGLGGCLAGLLSIYALVLTVFATKVEHRLTSGKAIAVVLVPVLIVAAIGLCVAVTMIGFLTTVVQ